VNRTPIRRSISRAAVVRGDEQLERCEPQRGVVRQRAGLRPGAQGVRHISLGARREQPIDHLSCDGQPPFVAEGGSGAGEGARGVRVRRHDGRLVARRRALVRARGPRVVAGVRVERLSETSVVAAQPPLEERQRGESRFAIRRATGAPPGFKQIEREESVVVERLLPVRLAPGRVDRVAVKAAVRRIVEP
jgi:hypothetical protein